MSSNAERWHGPKAGWRDGTSEEASLGLDFSCLPAGRLELSASQPANDDLIKDGWQEGKK